VIKIRNRRIWFKILAIESVTVKKRLFIAIDISEEARKMAAYYMEEMAGHFPGIAVKWEKPEKLHFTLKFLGSVDDGIVESVIEVVKQQADNVGRFEVEIRGTGAFPSAKQPRILWLGVNEPTGKMKQLAAGLESKCAKLGFEPESRPFNPHLTLARIREPRTAGRLGTSHVGREFGPITFSCRDLILFESHLSAHGSFYTKLYTAAFVG
jgi:2'-5' RNA ligase